MDMSPVAPWDPLQAWPQGSPALVSCGHVSASLLQKRQSWGARGTGRGATTQTLQVDPRASPPDSQPRGRGQGPGWVCVCAHVRICFKRHRLRNTPLLSPRGQRVAAELEEEKVASGSQPQPPTPTPGQPFAQAAPWPEPAASQKPQPRGQLL